MRLSLWLSTLACFAAAVFVAGIASSQEPDKWEAANAKVVRLSPAKFPQLPRAIRDKLADLGCTIPQTHLGGAPHNVIRGEFGKEGQQDWAVLCSIERKSSIRVFWGGPARCEEEFQPVEDRLSLAGIGDDKIGYSAQIQTVGREFIERHYQAYGGPKPPAITHHGINVAFLGKGSAVLYCHKGQWLTLTGAD